MVPFPEAIAGNERQLLSGWCAEMVGKGVSEQLVSDTAPVGIV